MPLTTYTAGEVLTAASLNANFTFAAASPTSGLVCVKAETTVTATNTVTADGVFTSSYTNYFMLVNYLITGAGQLKIKLRASGTNASTNYNYEQIQGSSSTVTGAVSASQTSFVVADYGAGLYASTVIELFNPQLAQATTILVRNTAPNGAYTAPLNTSWKGNHSTATAYDGIEIATSGTTFTGNYAIYGYSKTL